MSPTAGPRIRRRIVGHPRMHRIQLYVTAAGQQIRVRLDRTGAVPTLPKCPRSGFLPIYESVLPPGKPLHQLSQSRNRFSRPWNQVDMIRHQTEPVHLDAMEIFELFLRSQVVPEIGFLLKHHLLVATSCGQFGSTTLPSLGIVRPMLRIFIEAAVDRKTLSEESKSVPFFSFTLDN